MRTFLAIFGWLNLLVTVNALVFENENKIQDSTKTD
jgi:hypothetical protein